MRTAEKYNTENRANRAVKRAQRDERLLLVAPTCRRFSIKSQVQSTRLQYLHC